MSKDQWYFLLGLANRARKICSGESSVIKAVRKNDAKLVLVAQDASDRTKKTLQDKCRYYGVELCTVSDQYELGKAIGKDKRVSVAVLDQGFAKKLISLLR
jgi:ribosomal protein L7Ae-like RNA K-turn-binding protein